MKHIFVDTVALVALGNKRDMLHEQALKVKKHLDLSKQKFITSDAVILEFCNAFSDIGLRPLAIRTIEAINASECWECVHITPPLMGRGFERFRRMQDKEWSLVDCISMIIAEQFGIREIFTADHHFNQAGFVRLLQHPKEGGG